MKISFLKEEGLWVKAQRLFYTKTNLKSRKKPNYIFFRTYKSKTAHLALELYKTYLVVGEMPGAVKEYLEQGT